jgi:hypothetical protein
MDIILESENNTNGITVSVTNKQYTKTPVRETPAVSYFIREKMGISVVKKADPQYRAII